MQNNEGTKADSKAAQRWATPNRGIKLDVPMVREAWRSLLHCIEDMQLPLEITACCQTPCHLPLIVSRTDEQTYEISQICHGAANTGSVTLEKVRDSHLGNFSLLNALQGSVLLA